VTYREEQAAAALKAEEERIAAEKAIADAKALCESDPTTCPVIEPETTDDKPKLQLSGTVTTDEESSNTGMLIGIVVGAVVVIALVVLLVVFRKKLPCCNKDKVTTMPATAGADSKSSITDNEVPSTDRPKKGKKETVELAKNIGAIKPAKKEKK
jgi:hypothetical protein